MPPPLAGIGYSITPWQRKTKIPFSQVRFKEQFSNLENHDLIRIGNMVLRRFLAIEQRADFGDKLGRNCDEGYLIRIVSGLNFGELFVFGLIFVVRDDFANALFVPSGRKSVLLHCSFHLRPPERL